MRLVPKPNFRPQHCAAIPFIAPSSHPEERWVDTGSEMPGFDNHVYLSESAVKAAADSLGFPSQREHDAVVAERDEALAELEVALKELATLKQMKTLVEQIRAPKATARR